ncbi:HNH endonuclease [Arthrobacter phage Sloopyjoe]|nr:hypothetical protein PBI_STARLORD_77 [Arthrobacter phage StarLord]WAB09493.1 HNH endonuclease [Arthrobacter phage Sloopyjoe]
MSEEWRTLPEFPKYEITSDGDVRNKWTKKQLNEVENKRTGAYSYSLRREDGSSTCRAYEGLIYSAFPELKPEEPAKPEKSTRSYSKRGLWVDIPGFPTYQAHPDGIVRYRISKRFREIHIQGDRKYVKLIDEYGRHRRYMLDTLMSDLFGKEAA